ncbi:MAG: hypothetical protein CYG60_14550 [Actinobacteria bacterium]|nr:MAG: hypothetical protein CYG60_14550 [Actinomycetota bacterium]
MGIYLEIARKAVEDYRREEPERRAKERWEQVSEIEGVLIRLYSTELEGGGDNHERLVERLTTGWNPYFTAERDVVEEAVRGATKRLAEGERHGDTDGAPDHAGPHGPDRRSDDPNLTHDEVTERSDVEEEVEAPEVGPEVPEIHLKDEAREERVRQVTESLRLRPECWCANANEIIDEGLFWDLGFEPTPGEVEAAQCEILGLEGETSS